MKLEHEDLEKLKKQLLAIIGRHIDLASYGVFFFGSRVNGRSVEQSDIDIGIEGDKPLPPGLLSDIQDEIEALPVLYKIDAVDFAKVNESFKAVAKQQVESVL